MLLETGLDRLLDNRLGPCQDLLDILALLADEGAVDVVLLQDGATLKCQGVVDAHRRLSFLVGDRDGLLDGLEHGPAAADEHAYRLADIAHIAIGEAPPVACYHDEAVGAAFGNVLRTDVPVAFGEIGKFNRNDPSTCHSRADEAGIEHVVEAQVGQVFRFSPGLLEGIDPPYLVVNPGQSTCLQSLRFPSCIVLHNGELSPKGKLSSTVYTHLGAQAKESVH